MRLRLVVPPDVLLLHEDLTEEAPDRGRLVRLSQRAVRDGERENLRQQRVPAVRLTLLTT